MNGNFKTLITIAATPLLLLSCSDEVKLATESEGENLVSLTVQLPEELGTRAFGEASKIKSMHGEDFNVCNFDYQAKRLIVKVKAEKEGEVEVSLVRF